MQFIYDNILSLIIFFPLLGTAVILIMPKGNKGLVRWTALLFSLVPLALTLQMWGWFQALPCHDIAVQACFDQNVTWFEVINSNFHIGIDGISLSMILLTVILTPLAIIISWNIEEKVNLYMALFLMLEMGMLGVFASLDLIIFFVFWEIGLVPMYFLINIWGSKNRRYASFKFFIYTIAGSLGLLLSIQLIGLVMGTFDIPTLMTTWIAFDGVDGKLFGVSVSLLKNIGFWLFSLSFAIKVPVWPFHTWLPDAHTEAPTAGSMMLAGVLLKLGAFGFLRLVLPLFPDQAHTYAPVLAILATMAIVMGAFSSFAQTDFKRLVAYSSINHMGWVVLAIAAAAWVGGGADNPNRINAIIAMNGAVLQMFNHGIGAAAMFALVGMMYDRLHTRDLTKMGGLWIVAPIYGGIMVFSSLASLGLPGLNGFVSEFLIVRGVWAVSPLFTLMTAISMLGLLFTGAYILKGIKFVLLGPLNEDAVALAHGKSLEIGFRETLALAPLLVLMLVLGVYPTWLLQVINDTVTMLLS